MVVYLIRNRVNGKVYIGKTVDRLRSRWARHLYHARVGKMWALSCAIRKYGHNAFEIRPLRENVESREALNKLEIALIECWRSNDPKFGYNMTDGGDDGSHTPESREKLRLAGLGNKRGIGNRGRVGQKHTAEWIALQKGIRKSPATEFKKGEYRFPESGFKPRTVCKRGHDFTPENTIIQHNGNKACRTCRRAIRSRRWHIIRQKPIPQWATALLGVL